MAAMNTRESIFEVQWTSQTSGSWMWMMFHRNAYVPGDSFSWAKWCTPSRNLTKAYDAEGDTERKNAFHEDEVIQEFTPDELIEPNAPDFQCGGVAVPRVVE